LITITDLAFLECYFVSLWSPLLTLPFWNIILCRFDPHYWPCLSGMLFCVALIPITDLAFLECYFVSHWSPLLTLPFWNVILCRFDLSKKNSFDLPLSPYTVILTSALVLAPIVSPVLTYIWYSPQSPCLISSSSYKIIRKHVYSQHCCNQRGLV
jgi:hypothetical protein